MTTEFKHNLLVEERMFSLDIAALGEYDSEFKVAYESGKGYKLEITLSQLYTICPRKHQRKQQYERLVRFLTLKGIVLKITSRKHDKSEEEYDKDN